MGGDRIEYNGNLSTPTAGIATVKIHLNSTISTPGARYSTIDIKDFYLGTPMSEYKYMHIPIGMIPQVIINQYNLLPLMYNGFVMIEIRKEMYGLPQTGILANEQLRAHLATQGYHQVTPTPDLFTHSTWDISFILVIADFGVKYTSRANFDHLVTTTQQKYTTTIDRSGKLYCGLTIAWNYSKQYVDISMPGYIERCIQCFAPHLSTHPPPKPQHAPQEWTKPKYGAKTQFTPPPDTTPPLSASAKTVIQEVVSTILYYARAIDSTVLVALGTIGTQQSKPSTKTQKAIDHLLHYVATHPDATVRFYASNMILNLHSDASYISEYGARSRAGVYFFLSSEPNPSSTLAFNGSIFVLSHIIKNVLASAAEAELGSLFFNTREAIPICNTLIDLGHAQPPTPITTNNACAAGIANATVKQKISKAIDMRFYWICDRVRQG